MANYAVNRYEGPGETTCSGAPPSELRSALRAPSSELRSALRAPSSAPPSELRAPYRSPSSECSYEPQLTPRAPSSERRADGQWQWRPDAGWVQTLTQTPRRQPKSPPCQLRFAITNPQLMSVAHGPREELAEGQGATAGAQLRGSKLSSVVRMDRKTSGYVSSGSECDVSEEEQQLAYEIETLKKEIATLATPRNTIDIGSLPEGRSVGGQRSAQSGTVGGAGTQTDRSLAHVTFREPSRRSARAGAEPGHAQRQTVVRLSGVPAPGVSGAQQQTEELELDSEQDPGDVSSSELVQANNGVDEYVAATEEDDMWSSLSNDGGNDVGVPWKSSRERRSRRAPSAELPVPDVRGTGSVLLTTVDRKSSRRPSRDVPKSREDQPSFRVQNDRGSELRQALRAPSSDHEVYATPNSQGRMCQVVRPRKAIDFQRECCS